VHQYLQLRYGSHYRKSGSLGMENDVFVQDKYGEGGCLINKEGDRSRGKWTHDNMVTALLGTVLTKFIDNPL